MADPIKAYPIDEYDRTLYPDNVIPPADAGFAQWRGRTCAPDPGNPGRTVTPLPDGHHRVRETHRYACVGGWIASGDWWLHCGRCRPSARALRKQLEADQ